MIVEDEQDLTTLLKFIFEKFGYEVVEAQNGQIALNLLGIGAHPKQPDRMPDIIITDVMMPVVDGYTLVARLQENDSTRKIPVIVITAKANTKELFQFASNIAEFVEKPFEPKNLKEIVEKVLKK